MSKKYSKKNSMKQRQMLGKIVKIFNEFPDKDFNYKHVSVLLNIESESMRMFVSQLMHELASEDFLKETSKGKFRLNAQTGNIEGVVLREGVKTYVEPDGGGRAIFIPERKTLHALLGDRVRVYLYAQRHGMQPEGEVLEIIKRAKDTFVGVLQVSDSYAFLNVDHKILTNDIFIPRNKLNGGSNGQKAVVKLLEWNENSKNPVGEVIDILGNKGDNNTEMHAILAEFGLPYRYPEDVEREATTIDSGITPAEIAKRLDMRNITTFTIDPLDAKDFDDALSIRKLPNGNWEAGIHIADVTHYVTPNSVIDKEGYQRATSVYLVDRTVPMLPEHLSNGICSLRQDEEKLTFSVVCEMSDNAEVINYKIVKTVIKSDRRFTYEEAQEIIETGRGDFAEEMLILDKLAKKLRDERFANGAIAFDRTEVRFKIDEQGKPVSVYFKQAKDSNKLVEEFMLLANEIVAQHIGKVPKGRKAKTFVYRIHDTPNPDKLKNFAEFIRRFGYNLKTSGSKTAISSAVNKLLDEVEGKPEQNLVETLAVRSMAKAVYSTSNIGHYGLAMPFYTHFTSPIRRYPDMMVHRLLEYYANGGASVNAVEYEQFCEHASGMEQLAANAERASIKYKQIEFLADNIGEVFDGVISGVTQWGIYVELIENKCEGMIPIRELDDDYYMLDEKNYCLEGRQKRRKFQLGDNISVRLTRADLDKKQMDFAPAK
ncbi:MAG: ribonuclease R [Prevotellaceae bacterium]|jgi:ribonuclease R|nr:ribonuclease R [Prevotellaceae bacterium]